jgi:hypothetical protein
VSDTITLMGWLSDNYKWLFDGVAGAAVVAVIGWLFHHFSQGRQRGTAALTAQGAKVTNSPVASGSGITQTINSPTINVSLPAPIDATSAPQEGKEQPPCLNFVQSRSVLLHQSNTGVWIEASTDLQHARRGLVAQFRNRPNNVGQQAPKASSVTASLIFKSPNTPEELHINHAVWLGRFERFVSFYSGETHQLLLAVKLIPYVTFENPNTSNPFRRRWRSGISIRQPQAFSLAGGDGEVEITLVDSWNVTVFTGLFDYRLTADEMYLKQRT